MNSFLETDFYHYFGIQLSRVCTYEILIRLLWDFKLMKFELTSYLHFYYFILFLLHFYFIYLHFYFKKLFKAEGQDIGAVLYQGAT